MNHFQIDLFNNNPDKIVNALVMALCKHKETEAKQLMQLFQKNHPSHSQLFDFQNLLDAQKRLYLPIKDIQHEANEMRYLSLLATKLLGKSAQKYLILFWQHLAQSLQGQRFDPLEPELHCSFMCSEAMDWKGAQIAIKNEPQWHEHSILVIRLGKALYFLGELDTALEVWFHLFWQFPSEAVTAISSPTNPYLALRKRWQVFDNLEEEIKVTAFPAWMLLTGFKHRCYSTAKSLPPTNIHAKNYYAIRNTLLLKQKEIKNPQAELGLRIALKNTDENLLKWYLDKLQV